jgi:hypothetical protein
MVVRGVTASLPVRVRRSVTVLPSVMVVRGVTASLPVTVGRSVMLQRVATGGRQVPIVGVRRAEVVVRRPAVHRLARGHAMAAGAIERAARVLRTVAPVSPVSLTM